MKPSLKVLAPGFHTTVQDLGRPGYQAIGVPVSGGLDSFSLQLANALVGNPPGAPALEILLAGPQLEVAAETARVALVGAGAGLATDFSPGPVPTAQSITLSRGHAFKISAGRQSACCYLAVEGGLAVAPVLGSASTYVRAGIGGIEGRALRDGDFVPLVVARASERPELRLSSVLPGSGDQTIRIVLGPQQEYFTEAAVTTLLTEEFRVSPNADRMGMRLEGPLLRHRGGWDIVSDAIATGAIQVPGSGQPIVLLADHQTTGGYPKVATVVSADLPVIGRRRPGDPVRFEAVKVETAEALCRDEARRLANLVAALEAMPERREIDVASLYGENLVSGVVSGVE
jgi:biotin-dependent carboxylase-like uncharacterized protein